MGFGASTFGADAFGAETDSGATAVPDGIASGSTLGAPVVSVITPNGIASGASVGAPTVSVIAPNGIASTSTLGAPSGITYQVADGIASTSSVGTPSSLSANVPDGITSTSAVGTPSGVTSQVADGIASTSALGAPVVSVIFPDGITSTSSVGTPSGVTSQVADGIASTSAVGAPVVSVIFPDGIASTSSVGTPVVSVIFPDGITSTSTLGAPSGITYQVADGIASTSVLGAPSVSTIVPTGIASTSALGTPSGVTSQVPNGIASASTLGTPTTVTYHTPSGIASTSLLGAPTVGHSVNFFGIPGQGAFGPLIVAGPVNLASIPGQGAFGPLRVNNYGTLRTFGPVRGSLLGGARVGLLGYVLDASTCQDAFDDGTVGADFTLLDASGGATTEYTAPSAGLELWTGTGGGTAGVRAVATTTSIDVTATVTALSYPRSRTSPPTLVGALELWAAGDVFSLGLAAVDGALVVVVRATTSGAEVYRTTVSGGVGEEVVFRILRHGRVHGFVNGVEVVNAGWVSGTAQQQMRAAAPTGVSARGLVTAYSLAPVVTFGDVPVTETRRLTDGAMVVAAPPASTPGPVDVTVIGCLSTESIVDGFTYDEDGTIVGQTQRTRLYVNV